MKRFSVLLLFAALLAAGGLRAQAPSKVNVYLPDTDQYQVLRCDFHIHTVFSDGGVWPTLRVDEAVGDGLDAISITDHVEYRPKEEDFTTRSHNRSAEIARPAAERAGLIYIQGTEVTRGMPPGHFNAIFVNDAGVLEPYVPENRRDGANIVETLREIKRQGAFVVWNHPNFPDHPLGAILHPIHRELIAEGLVDGIEVINGPFPVMESLDWCLENDLAVIGASDVHTAMALELENRGLPHRSMTLVLARERSPEAIHEALAAKRTVAVMGHNLYGRAEHARAVFEASIDTRILETAAEGMAILSVRNNGSIPYTLEVTRSGEARVGRGEGITLGAYSTTLIPIAARERGTPLPDNGRTFEVAVKNIFIASDKNLTCNFEY
jgi:hypothetical protein